MGKRRSPQHQIQAANRSIRNDFADLKHGKRTLAFVGRGPSDSTVLVPDRPGYIFAHIPEKIVTGTIQEYTVAQVYSEEEHRWHAAVEIAQVRHSNRHRYEVLGPWEMGIGTTQNPGQYSGGVRPHHQSHELYNPQGGSDPVMLDGMQIKNLQVHPTSPPSSRVVIGGGFYIWGRTVQWYDETEYELASYVPTGTVSPTYISLWLDPVTQEIVPVSRTETPLTESVSELVVFPEEDYIPLACVRLASGVYQIQWSIGGTPNFINMRLQQFLMPGDILTSGHPLDPSGGFHTGTLDAKWVILSDPSGTYTGTTIQDILEAELGPERARVKVSSNDQVAEYLGLKLTAGANVTITELNDGGVEQLEIASAGGGGGSGSTLGGLTDVDIIAPSDRDYVEFVSATSSWLNTPLDDWFDWRAL